ncbi:ATPase AAA [Candidatus Magnetomorum sp. HK-1]|nr:ATPase AAA [Candidatus Magnetomorum sp. HK-1]
MQLNAQKRFPLNRSDFKTIIEDDYYFIDKSMLIHHLISGSSDILLFPRPRRFGKTCNLSMIRYFFEKSDSSNAHLFSKLAIKNQETWKFQGKYPVIFISLRNCTGLNWQRCFSLFTHIISSEYRRHAYLLNSNVLDPLEKLDFESIMRRKADPDTCALALKNLSKHLKEYYNQKVIILCDEYDTPIHNGYLSNYYEEIIDFMRLFLGSAYKDNDNLYKGLLTGILRVARESIFSELNNLDVFTVVDDQFSEFFGITENEIQKLLLDYDLKDHESIIKKAYDGYKFGNHTIYNPWSVLHYCANPNAGKKPYWINTSANGLIRELIFQEHMLKISDIQALIDGKPVWKIINENLVMKELKTFRDAVWNLLLFSGYLTITEKKPAPDHSDSHICCLRIPNTEIKNYFINEMMILKSTQEIDTLMASENHVIQKVFISYNHKDLAFVERLKNDLENAGIQLTIDIERMKFGDDIQEFIEHSVEFSDITLSVISENSLASPWVMLETLETFQQEDYIKAMRYIPVMIDQHFQSPDFASTLIAHIEKNIDLIFEEIARLSKKYVSTQSLNVKKERLINLRSNIDHVLLKLDERLIADFSTPKKYEINISRLVQSIKQI